MNSGSEKSPLVFIPNLYPSTCNLGYHRGACHDHFIILKRRGSIPLAPEEKLNRHFHLRRTWSCAVALCQLCLCNSEEHFPLFNRLFHSEGRVSSTLPSFPLVVEKSHLYCEIANQPDNHHTEIAPMKRKQCYI